MHLTCTCEEKNKQEGESIKDKIDSRSIDFFLYLEIDITVSDRFSQKGIRSGKPKSLH